MSKESIEIKDFSLFIESIKPFAKITQAAKITVNEFGAKICAKNESGRCEVKTNSISSKNPIVMIVGDINNFSRILSSVDSIHGGDCTDVNFFVDGNYIKIESKKFKTRLSMGDGEKLSATLDDGFKGDLSVMPDDYSFITNSNYIKRLNNHSFLFSDINSIRVYIKDEDGMNNNTVHAKIGDENNDFENYATFELGMLTNGKIGENKVILDFNGLNFLNLFQSDEITIKKPTGRNSMFSFVSKTGKNGTFMNVTIVSRILVK